MNKPKRPTPLIENSLSTLSQLDFLTELAKFSHIILRNGLAAPLKRQKKEAITNLRKEIEQIYSIEATDKQIIKRISNCKQRLKSQLDVKKYMRNLHLADRRLYELIQSSNSNLVVNGKGSSKANAQPNIECKSYKANDNLAIQVDGEGSKVELTFFFIAYSFQFSIHFRQNQD